MMRMVPDALSLEYKRDYGAANGDLNFADLVNNPAASGKCRVLGLGFEEKLFDILRWQLGTPGDEENKGETMTAAEFGRR